MRLFYSYFPKQYGLMLNFFTFIAQPFKKFLLKCGLNIYFGGKDQDKWVSNELFHFKKNGFFIDLAATDGITDNNSFFLEKKLNWTGICIEPNKEYFHKLHKNRNAIKLNEVVSSEDELNVNFIFNKGIGGIIGDKYDNNFSMREDLIKQKSHLINEVKTKSLVSILKKLQCPKNYRLFKP